MSLLEIRDLSLLKGDKAILNDLSLVVQKNRVHAIIGPNGAGKSTIANTIMGLSGYQDFEGDILFDNESVKGMSVDKRARLGITLLFQEPARFEGLSVRSFILAGAQVKSSVVVIDALEKVGLDPLKYMRRAVDKTLSGGERKRIELASIYAMKPKLILMDEPDSGVDIDSVQYIFRVIDELRKEGSTVLLITHSAEVLKHADYAFLICNGRMVEQGKMTKMYNYFNGTCIPCTHKGEPDMESRNNIVDMASQVSGEEEK